MTTQEVSRILRVLRAIWPDAPVNESTVTAWAWAFEDVPYALLEDATKQWIRGGKPFFPKPADLLALISVDLVAPDLIPEAAWAEVLREIHRGGFRAKPSFSHPLIAQAVKATGWETICLSERPEVVRAQFERTLTALLERERRQVRLGRVAIAEPEALPESPAPMVKLLGSEVA